MPKGRNTETERAIRVATWQLFLEKGVEATSYTDISLCSGIARPLVQRYFPKKELLVQDCVAAIRDSASDICDATFPDKTDPLVRLYLLGQINVAEYFCCDGLRHIMLDVFASRRYTQQTIDDSFRWTIAKILPDRPELARMDEPDDLIMAMGGLYELLYVYLTRGTTPSCPTITLPSVHVFAKTFGVPVPPDGLSQHAIPAHELDRLALQAVDLIAW